MTPTRRPGSRRGEGVAADPAGDPGSAVAGGHPAASRVAGLDPRGAWGDLGRSPYKAGIPGNGEPFPDGAKMAKIHWNPKKNETAPGQPTVPGTQHDVDFMVKDGKRLADSGGWGWAAFEYDAASDTFRPATAADKPPQGSDAKCGFSCHTVVKNRDYVFTDYGKR
jgi:Cytochrome P460